MDSFYWITTGIKIAAIVVVLLQVVPIMVWVERRGSALMQNRLGPNRVGPLGLFQSLADAVKFFLKEDFAPAHVEKFYFTLAPLVVVIPAFMTFAVIPFGGDITLQGQLVHLQITDLNVGILYCFSIASLGVYGIIMAGWASNNKYAMLGGLRSSSQMISYELSLGLSILGMVLLAGSLNLRDIVAVQDSLLFGFLPKWGVFVQPLGFLIFLVSIFAETNRLPFDLPEGESEIVAGYHTEYGSMKFAMFFMAEYINMFVASALVTTLFFGGYLLLPGFSYLIEPLAGLFARFIADQPAEWARLFLQVVSFAAKVAFFLWFFVWVRWTIPRFRYDQLMNLGWKVMLPLSILNVVASAVLIYMGVL
jgi:NADH-quinone oxidoreductase subunit H